MLNIIHVWKLPSTWTGSTSGLALTHDRTPEKISFSGAQNESLEISSVRADELNCWKLSCCMTSDACMSIYSKQTWRSPNYVLINYCIVNLNCMYKSQYTLWSVHYGLENKDVHIILTLVRNSKWYRNAVSKIEHTFFMLNISLR